jgi:L-seryl-tRNA(Ser) seleniumtransferase
MLDEKVEALSRRARRIARRLRSQGVPAQGRATRAALGGGTTPAETLPSYGLAIGGGQRVLDALREGEPPIVGRIEEDEVILDLRTVLRHQERHLETALLAAYGSQPAGK